MKPSAQSPVARGTARRANHCAVCWLTNRLSVPRSWARRFKPNTDRSSMLPNSPAWVDTPPSAWVLSSCTSPRSTRLRHGQSSVGANWSSGTFVRFSMWKASVARGYTRDRSSFQCSSRSRPLSASSTKPSSMKPRSE